nr:hypothetical protein BaRGS_034474 [Batillaria attramentaria]
MIHLQAPEDVGGERVSVWKLLAMYHPITTLYYKSDRVGAYTNFTSVSWVFSRLYRAPSYEVGSYSEPARYGCIRSVVSDSGGEGKKKKKEKKKKDKAETSSSEGGNKDKKEKKKKKKKDKDKKQDTDGASKADQSESAGSTDSGAEVKKKKEKEKIHKDTAETSGTRGENKDKEGKKEREKGKGEISDTKGEAKDTKNRKKSKEGGGREDKVEKLLFMGVSGKMIKAAVRASRSLLMGKTPTPSETDEAVRAADKRKEPEEPFFIESNRVYGTKASVMAADEPRPACQFCLWVSDLPIR